MKNAAIYSFGLGIASLFTVSAFAWEADLDQALNGSNYGRPTVVAQATLTKSVKKKPESRHVQNSEKLQALAEMNAQFGFPGSGKKGSTKLGRTLNDIDQVLVNLAQKQTLKKSDLKKVNGRLMEADRLIAGNSKISGVPQKDLDFYQQRLITEKLIYHELKGRAVE